MVSTVHLSSFDQVPCLTHESVDCAWLKEFYCKVIPLKRTTCSSGAVCNRLCRVCKQYRQLFFLLVFQMVFQGLRFHVFQLSMEYVVMCLLFRFGKEFILSLKCSCL